MDWSRQLFRWKVCASLTMGTISRSLLSGVFINICMCHTNTAWLIYRLNVICPINLNKGQGVLTSGIDLGLWQSLTAECISHGHHRLWLWEIISLCITIEPIVILIVLPVPAPQWHRSIILGELLPHQIALCKRNNMTQHHPNLDLTLWCITYSRNYTTRAHDGPLMDVPKPNPLRYIKSVSYRGPTSWNKVKPELRCLKDFGDFVRAVKSYHWEWYRRHNTG